MRDRKNIKEAQYEINEKKQRVLIYEHGKTEFFLSMALWSIPF